MQNQDEVLARSIESSVSYTEVHKVECKENGMEIFKLKSKNKNGKLRNFKNDIYTEYKIHTNRPLKRDRCFQRKLKEKS